MQNKIKKTEISSIIVVSGLYLLITLLLGLNRYYSFFASYDHGIFNQVFWNNLHGNFYHSSLASAISTHVTSGEEIPRVFDSYLGHHFTPNLLLLLPIYFLFPSPATLVIIQSILITGAGIILYFLAREYVEHFISILIVISFYSAIAILVPTLSNFDNISQLPILVFSLLLSLEKKNWWLFSLFSVLILGVRQEAGLNLFGIGVYLIASKHYPRQGVLICLISLVYMLFITNIIMPQFTQDVGKRLMVDKFGQYIKGENPSTLAVIWGMITQPWLVIWELISPIGKTIEYLFGQWLSLALIPAVSPSAWIISIFPLLTPLLGQGKSVLSLNIRYAMMVTPGLFYGAILWWGGQNFNNFQQNITKLNPRKLTLKFKRFWVSCIVISLLLTFISSATELSRVFYFILPDSFQPLVYVSLPRQWQHSANIYQLLVQIPDDASVSATNNIIAHLSSRRAIIRLPIIEFRNDNKEAEKVDFIIADLWELQRYGIIFDKEKGWLEAINSLINNVTLEKTYDIIDSRDNVVLLKKI
ncbi:MAG: DUF2079 domain-containing protein [Cyanobacteria bacterium]|nr:DUF2079 domain-containing protein [Cyanobacteria bacterium CG_2015-16_32_12]NCO77118.1 DUF2079 domain-containing protein [Cyanobacteria bacterium CG_2015-22_32_23]NCQ42453.1 DUF2079 domain-containing protein [Cyanobacteria bacterium CG_2015-04_32_10]NCS85969.1 DUF2079 domain-containing protein [Cyanobacteria bacterium CG_2015-02_32_10]